MDWTGKHYKPENIDAKYWVAVQVVQFNGGDRSTNNRTLTRYWIRIRLDCDAASLQAESVCDAPGQLQQSAKEAT